jgi:hypothetical protein
MSKQSQQTLADLAVEADQAAHKTSQGLQGKIPIEGKEDEGLGHPIHPATVHWPIAVSLFSSISGLIVAAPIRLPLYTHAQIQSLSLFLYLNHPYLPLAALTPSSSQLPSPPRP